MTSLLSIDSDAKTVKGRKRGFLTGALFMSPERLGKGNACPFATDSCKATCIAFTGMGVMPGVRRARDVRRARFDEWQHGGLGSNGGFIKQLRRELDALVRKGKREGLDVAVRLNATSDIRWERVAPSLFTDYPEIQFYDYTKWPAHMRGRRPIAKENLPSNYHLTYSWTPEWDRMGWYLLNGFTVAVPFAPTDPADKGTLPPRFNGAPLVDGDEHDLTFLHPAGSIIGLRFKGKGGSRPSYTEGMFAQEF